MPDNTDDIQVTINIGDITVSKETHGKPPEPRHPILAMLDGRSGGGRPPSVPQDFPDPDDFRSDPGPEEPGNLMNRWDAGTSAFDYSDSTDEDGIPYLASFKGRAEIDLEDLEDPEVLQGFRQAARDKAQAEAEDTGYTKLISETHNFLVKDGRAFHSFALIFDRGWEIEVELEDEDE